jgi:hypothetical protein
MSRLLSFLEGSANGFSAACCAAGANGDLICGAVGVAVVVNAVLYVTANALDVLLGCTFLGVTALIILVHF